MPRRVLAKEGPDPIDVHVGNRVRLRRTLLGMSKSALGEALGLTSQQVDKYEHGVNRISASRLWRLTQVLGVPVSFFFDDMLEGLSSTSFSGRSSQRSLHRVGGHTMLARERTPGSTRATWTGVQCGCCW